MHEMLIIFQGGWGGGPFTGALPLNLPEDGKVQKQHYS